MYEYSRWIYRAIADEVRPPACMTVEDGRRHVLTSIEAMVDRLAADPVCTASPARRLFGDIRFCFPLIAQPRVREVVGIGLQAALDEAMRRRARRCDDDGKPVECRATTRQGTPCRREPVGDSPYCPSHGHLGRTEHEPVLVA